jgi:hypothetical protein
MSPSQARDRVCSEEDCCRRAKDSSRLRRYRRTSRMVMRRYSIAEHNFVRSSVKDGTADDM